MPSAWLRLVRLTVKSFRCDTKQVRSSAARRQPWDSSRQWYYSWPWCRRLPHRHRPSCPPGVGGSRTEAMNTRSAPAPAGQWPKAPGTGSSTYLSRSPSTPRATSTSPNTYATTVSEFLTSPAPSSPSGEASAPFCGTASSITPASPHRLLGQRFYVADTGNNRVQKFDVLRRLRRRVGRLWQRGRPIRRWRAIATVLADSPHVSDSENHRIHKFDSSGDLIGKRGHSGPRGRPARLPPGPGPRTRRATRCRRCLQHPDRQVPILRRLHHQVGQLRHRANGQFYNLSRHCRRRHRRRLRRRSRNPANAGVQES